MVLKVVHFVAIGLLFLWSFGACAEQTYPYEPHKVTLSGIVIFKGYYGPPNFGENPETDSWGNDPILILDHPITVIGDTDKESLSQTTFHKVKRLHIVSSDPLWPILLANKNKHVTMNGTLFQAITAHHRTNVLITPETIEQTPSPNNIRHELRGKNSDRTDHIFWYEPDMVDLSGTLVLEEHHGQFEIWEDPGPDTWSLYPILELDTPISVIGDKNLNHLNDSHNLNDATFHNLKKLQIVGPPELLSNIQTHANKHVRIHGTLFQKVVAPHVTDVLIFANKLEVN